MLILLLLHRSDQGYVAGAQVAVDTNGFELKNHTYSLGYLGKGFELTGSLTNHQDLEWRLFQSYKDVLVGFRLGWGGGFNNTEFGIAAMYKPNKHTFVKGRINEQGHVGVAYGFKPTPGK